MAAEALKLPLPSERITNVAAASRKTGDRTDILRFGDVIPPRTTISLSRIDANGALFALRAMGFSAITDDDALPADDAYRGNDVELMGGDAPGGGAPRGNSLRLTVIRAPRPRSARPSRRDPRSCSC